jgi:hypothetical protein
MESEKKRIESVTDEESSLVTDQEREKIRKIINKFTDEDGFVSFGEIAHGIFGQQTQ